jgi:hypothetical protein
LEPGLPVPSGLAINHPGALLSEVLGPLKPTEVIFLISTVLKTGLVENRS